VKLHEQYDSWTIENDICLLELAESVTFNEHVGAISWPADHEEYDAGTICTITGWGTTAEGGSLAGVLQKVRS
jgi:Trypsin